LGGAYFFNIKEEAAVIIASDIESVIISVLNRYPVKRAALFGSAAGNPSIFFGGALYPPEDRFSMADGGKIGEMIKLVNT
jgi:hypothetical protein